MNCLALSLLGGQENSALIFGKIKDNGAHLIVWSCGVSGDSSASAVVLSPPLSEASCTAVVPAPDCWGFGGSGGFSIVTDHFSDGFYTVRRLPARFWNTLPASMG